MSAADEMYEEFRVEMAEIAQEIDEAMLRWESDPFDPELPDRIFRQLHTLKGSAGFLELHDLADLCHAAEDLFTGYRANPRAPTRPELAALNEAIATIQGRLSTSRSQHKSPLKPLADRLRTLARTPPSAQAEKPEGRSRSRATRTNPNLRVFRESPAKPQAKPRYASGQARGPAEPRPLPKAGRRPVAERRTAQEQAPESRSGSTPPPATEPGRLLGSRLLGTTSRTDFGASSFGPWSPERLEALHQGRRPSELRAEGRREAESEAQAIDPLDLLLQDELAAANLIAALSETKELLENEVLFPDLEAVGGGGTVSIGPEPVKAGRHSGLEGGTGRPEAGRPAAGAEGQGTTLERAAKPALEVPDGPAAPLARAGGPGAPNTGAGAPARGPVADPVSELLRIAPLADVDLAVPPVLSRPVGVAARGREGGVDPDMQETLQDTAIPVLPAELLTLPELAVPGDERRTMEVGTEGPAGAARETGGLEARAGNGAEAAIPVAAEVVAAEEGGLFIERATTVRVDVARLDNLLNLLGDLLQEKHRHATLVESLVSERGEEPVVAGLATSHRRLERLLGDLQDTVLSTRMLPVQGVFRRYPRIVKDLAARLGKEVELLLGGEETELDRALLEGLFDPLIHLLRNSIDHGIEMPADRVRRGKSRKGTIALTASHEGNQVVLEIRDDGRGIDPNETAARAVAQGLLDLDHAKEMNDQEKVDLIFLPGFTSRTQVTETSGRGVGMSVVRDHLRRIGGLITVRSRPGEGTTLRIVMPLTLAILQVLLVRVGPTRYAVPLSSVVGVHRVERDRLTLYRGGWYLPRPGSMLPLFSLAALLGLETPHLPPERCYVAEVGVAEKRYGVWVDGFAGIFESVIKSLEGSLTRLPGVAGGTFIGGGDLVLVLDVGTLLEGQNVQTRA